MCIALFDSARTNADKRCVSAAAENSRAFFQPKLLRSLFVQSADLIRAFNNLCKVFHVNPEHLAHFTAPALLSGADIIKQRSESGIGSHDKFACHSCNQSFFNIKPFINSAEDFRLIVLHPEIFIYRILDTQRSCLCY